MDYSINAYANYNSDPEEQSNTFLNGNYPPFFRNAEMSGSMGHYNDCARGIFNNGIFSMRLFKNYFRPDVCGKNV